MIRIDLRDEFPGSQLDPYWIEHNKRTAHQQLRNIPAQFAGAELTDPDVTRWVRALAARAVADARAENPRVQHGPSLLLRGGTGTGKTHHVYAAIRTLWLSGVDCRWIVKTAADLLAELRPSGAGEAAFARHAKVPLLCLDDLGAHAVTEWTTDTLFRLINARYEAQLPIVVTSNLPMVSRDKAAVTLTDRLGDRISSRLVEMARTFQVPLKGEDRRRSNAPATSSL